jgi:hypothetical protein
MNSAKLQNTKLPTNMSSTTIANNEQHERENEEAIAFIIASTRIKHLQINFKERFKH